MRGLPNVGDVFGDYDITGVLGRGGMGVVYSANKRRLSRTEALKVLSPSWVEDAEYRGRFLREAETLASLDSPHIIHIYDYGDVDGTPYISTQLIRGGDLGDYIKDRGPLPVPLALTIAAQVASALEDAHGSGVIHRDVKPSNVLLREEVEPFAYLCDFGIARSESGGLTTTGTVVGTWAYLAPERCNGGQASAASDIYSVGCLLWAMLSGEAPYRGTDLAVAMAHLHEPIPQLEGDDKRTQRVNEVLVRSMAKQPTHRFTSARELQSALAELGEPARHAATPRSVLRASDEDTQIRRPTPPLPAPPVQRDRRPLLTVGILVAAFVLAGAVAAGVVLVGRGSRDNAASVRPSAASHRSRQTAKQLEKLTRVSYDGGARSQVAVQAFFSGPGQIRGFRLDANGSISSTRKRDLPATTDIHRMNGDFDGDGRTDAAILTDDHRGGQTVSVARSTGADFAAPTTWGHVDSLDGGEFSTVTGDFDGDRQMDIALIVSRPDSHRITVSILLSTGSRFRDAKPWSQQLHLTPNEVKFEPGDFNGDGRTDLVVVQANPDAHGKVLVMLSIGQGLLQPAPWANNVLRSGDIKDVKPLAGDFDGDGISDVLLVQATVQRKTAGVEAVFLRSERDTFENGVRWWTNTDWVLDENWMSTGDFDSDGRADAAVVQRSGRVGVIIRLLVSTGTQLRLAAAEGSWPLYSHIDTRTLNVIG